MQRGQLLLLDRGQRRHEHRLRVMKRRRCVQCQGNLLALRRAQRRNVLILRGAERIEDLGDIDHGGDVGTVIAITQLWREAGLHREVTGGPAGERFHDRSAVAVIQNQRRLPLHQTWRLQLGDFVQALVIDLDGETASQQGCRLPQLGRIRGIQGMHRQQVSLEP